MIDIKDAMLGSVSVPDTFDVEEDSDKEAPEEPDRSVAASIPRMAVCER